MDATELNGLAQALEKYSGGVILLPAKPSPDAVAAATALYLGLTKIGKNVALACSDKVESDLTASDKITQNISTAGDNLVISFPYEEGSIDKVDYNITGDKFNLIITPHSQDNKIDPQEVSFGYSGGKIEFVITLDAPSVRALGPIYQENQKQLETAFIINIDRHLANSYYGSVNIVGKNASSTSELVAQILTSLEIEMDPEMATNLYAGLSAATNNFSSYSVTAQTFEAAAQLLKSGAKKVRTVKQGAGAPADQPVSRPSFRKQPKAQPMPSQKDARPMEDVETAPDDIEDEEENAPEWLKPNIFGAGGSDIKNG